MMFSHIRLEGMLARHTSLSIEAPSDCPASFPCPLAFGATLFEREPMRLDLGPAEGRQSRLHIHRFCLAMKRRYRRS
jgi:hypothetical protein